MIKNITNHKRKVHLDLLRLIAIFFVIFNHTGEHGYMLFANDMASFVSIFYMFLSVLCKIAVPIFFMISGALLLRKEESLKQLFVKRILKIAIVLFFISVPYYYWLHRDNGIDVFSFFEWIYSNSASSSLWYLYSYLALLFMLPFLRSMVKNMKQQEFIYLIVGHIVFVGILPCLEFLVTNQTNLLHESFSPILFIEQNIFFALVGYYLEYIFDVEKHYKRSITIGVILSLIAILLTCFITYYQAKTETCTPHRLEYFFSCFICVPSITGYIIAKYIGSKINENKIARSISVLGSSVFGVYLIEKIVRTAVYGIYKICVPFIGSLASSLLWCVAVFFVSMIIVVALKNIPGIKKVVNIFI